MNQIAPIRAEVRAPAEPTPHRFTWPNVLRMCDLGLLGERRVELIDGEILEMPEEGELHQGLRDNLVNFFVRWFAAAGREDVLLSTNGPLRIAEYETPEPDIYLRPANLPLTRTGARETFLAIELAFITHAHDFGRKQPLYARFGVRELWIIDGVKHETVVHRGPRDDGSWTEIVRHAVDEQVAPLAFPGLGFRLSDHLPPEPAEPPPE